MCGATICLAAVNTAHAPHVRFISDVIPECREQRLFSLEAADLGKGNDPLVPRVHGVRAGKIPRRHKPVAAHHLPPPGTQASPARSATTEVGRSLIRSEPGTRQIARTRTSSLTASRTAPQVWSRRAQKFEKQLSVWDANAQLAAEGKDVAEGPEDGMVWWSNATKEELLRLKREADDHVTELGPLASSSEARAELSCLTVLSSYAAPP